MEIEIELKLNLAKSEWGKATFKTSKKKKQVKDHLRHIQTTKCTENLDEISKIKILCRQYLELR